MLDVEADWPANARSRREETGRPDPSLAVGFVSLLHFPLPAFPVFGAFRHSQLPTRTFSLVRHFIESRDILTWELATRTGRYARSAAATARSRRLGTSSALPPDGRAREESGPGNLRAKFEAQRPQ
jgi:hypothetical protein